MSGLPTKTWEKNAGNPPIEIQEIFVISIALMSGDYGL